MNKPWLICHGRYLNGIAEVIVVDVRYPESFAWRLIPSTLTSVIVIPPFKTFLPFIIINICMIHFIHKETFTIHLFCYQRPPSKRFSVLCINNAPIPEPEKTDDNPEKKRKPRKRRPRKNRKGNKKRKRNRISDKRWATENIDSE